MFTKPKEINLGQHFNFCIGHIEPTDDGVKDVGRFVIPDFQRGFVWTREQSVALIQSLWRGIPIGTYSYVQKIGSKYDLALVDGQQRVTSIWMYLNDEFEVYGAKWSEVPVVERRSFLMKGFPAYVTENDDEEFLLSYYTLMNFGGTPHK